MADYHKGPFLDMRPEGYPGLLLVIFALFVPFALVGDVGGNFIFWAAAITLIIATVLWVYFAHREKMRQKLMFPEFYPDESEEEKRIERHERIKRIGLTALLWLGLLTILFVPLESDYDKNRIIEFALAAIIVAILAVILVRWLVKNYKSTKSPN